MKRPITVIGMGEEIPRLLNHHAIKAIAAADIIFGAKRHLENITSEAEKVIWLSPFDKNYERIRGERNKAIVILATGDPLWFGIGSALLHHFKSEELHFIGNRSSFNLAASAVGWPLQDCYCLSAHGRSLDAFKAALQPNQRFLLLTSDADTIFAIEKELIQQNGFGSKIIALEHLESEQECIQHFKAGEVDKKFSATFYIVAIETTAATAPHSQLSAGLEDDLFTSDGQLTKQWMRAITLARLKPRRNEILWDIGAGSGSISIEWTRLTSGDSYAIERNAERMANLIKNKDNLGGNIHLIKGEIDDASIFDGLPLANAIFIGGGLVNIHQIEFFIANLQPFGRLVVNSVTQKGEMIINEAFNQFGGNLERFAMERMTNIGDQYGFRPSMRITQWWYQNG